MRDTELMVGAFYNPHLGAELANADGIDHLAMADPPAATDAWWPAIRERYTLLLHAYLGQLSEPLDERSIARARALAELYGSPWVAEHFQCLHTVDGAYNLNYVFPPLYTEEFLDRFVRNATALKDRLDQPLVMENIPGFFDVAASQLPEPLWLRRFFDATGAGFLLDLPHVWLEAHYHDVQLHHVLERKFGEPGLRLQVVIVSLEPHVRQVEQEARTCRVEKPPQPERLRQLARRHVEEAGNVLHDERLVQSGLERGRVTDEAVQELLGVERREDIVEIVGAVHGVQALEVLGHPGRVVQLGQRPRPRDRPLVERLGELAQIVVEQQRVPLANRRPPRVRRRRRIRHGQMVDPLRLGQLRAQVRIIERADHHLRHARFVIRCPFLVTPARRVGHTRP